MMRTFKIAAFALVATIAGLLASNEAEALLSKHNCTFCHSLHGAPNPQGVPTGFLPQNSPTNIEVLCLGCHFNPVDGSDPIYGTDTDGIAVAAVQPHRSDGGVANYHVTCIDCHEIHDNMPNWLDGLGAHTDASQPGTGGLNQKMIGTRDPDGTTPYAVIRTREKDFDRNGIPDRGPPDSGDPAQTCDETVINDCYTEERRYVVFEHADPVNQRHAWAENTDSGGTFPLEDPATDSPGYPGPTDPTVLRTLESDGATLTDNGTGAPWSAYDSICGMCHTQTANHNLFDGGGLAHNDTRACTDCHTHEGCFDKGGVCERVPESPVRDLQVDLVGVSSTSVNSGDTVTITVDVANLGDRYEGFDVRYVSDIDGFLGLSRAEVDANPTPPDPPGRTSQTIFDWVTTTAGVHTITAEIDPVIYETVIANNSATAAATVTVAGLDTHDVAVGAVTAPSPILQGNTEIVDVDISNPGTFTETFNVVLYDNTDDSEHVSPIGTLSSGALAAAGSITLNFSWNTTSASLGTHTLEAIADTVTDETNTGNNSATTTAVVAIHDVEVSAVTAPLSVDQDTIATVSVDVANLSSTGGFTDTVTVNLYNHTTDPTHTSPIDSPQSSIGLAPQGTDTLTFNWDTTGLSVATYDLWAIANTVTGETITGNNTATTTSGVITPVTHDVEVTSVTAPGTVDRGTSPTVTVRVTNVGGGGADETFNVVLYDDTDDPGHVSPIGTLGSGILADGNFIDLNFTWATVPATSLGAHTLTAVADAVPSETNTVDNTGSTTSTVTSHDIAVDLVTATPGTVTVGGTIVVDVDITNEGSFDGETFDVTLTSNDGPIQDWIGQSLDAGLSTQLTYSWDTSLASEAIHTLTATVSNVSGEIDTADNTATTTAEVTAAATVPAIESTVESSGSGTSTTVTTTAPRPDNDVYIVVGTKDGNGAWSSIPADWGTAIYDEARGNNTVRHTVWAFKGASVPVSYTISHDNEVTEFTFMHLTGADGDDIVAAFNSANGSGITATAPAATPTNGNTLLIRTFGADKQTLGNSSEGTTDVNVGNGGNADVSLVVSHTDGPAGGASTGTATSALGVSDDWAAGTLSINSQ